MTTIACYNFNNIFEGYGVFDDATITLSPVGWWKMNDNLATNVVVDETGLHNGILTGGNTSDKSVTGRINQALQLDGSGDYITIADHADFDFGISDFSIAFWVKTISASLSPNQEYGIITKAANYENSAGWGIELSTWAGVSTPNFGAFNTGQSTWGNSNIYKTLWINDVWHHVVFERVGGAMYLFIDGSYVASKNHADCALNVDNAQPIIIGDHSWGPESPIVIDDLRIYRGALNAATIATLAAGTEAIVTANVGAHNGRVVGSIPLVDGPIASKGRNFPGSSNNFIVVPHHSDFTATVAKTFEIWFTTGSSISSSYRYILMKNSYAGTNYPFALILTNGDPTILMFSIQDSVGQNANVATPTGTMIANRLYYIAATWNPTTKTTILYLNGIPVAINKNTSINVSSIDDTSNIGFGASASYTGYEWNGRIHDVRFSNVVKTAKEIYDTFHASNIQESL